MLSLKQCLQDIIDYKESTKNAYYTATGSHAVSKNAYVEVCALSGLPAGIYLVFGNVSISVSADVCQSACVRGIKNATDILRQDGKTNAVSGGGAQGHALVQVTSDGGSVNVQSYGYYTSSATFSGSLIAIKLI